MYIRLRDAWNLLISALDRKYEIANGNHDLHN